MLHCVVIDVTVSERELMPASSEANGLHNHAPKPASGIAAAIISVNNGLLNSTPESAAPAPAATVNPAGLPDLTGLEPQEQVNTLAEALLL